MPCVARCRRRRARPLRWCRQSAATPRIVGRGPGEKFPRARRGAGAAAMEFTSTRRAVPDCPGRRATLGQEIRRCGSLRGLPSTRASHTTIYGWMNPRQLQRKAASSAADGAVQPTIPPCARIIARVALLNSGSHLDRNTVKCGHGTEAPGRADEFDGGYAPRGTRMRQAGFDHALVVSAVRSACDK